MNESNKRKRMMAPLAVFVLMVAGGLALLFRNPQPASGDRGPYDYDVSPYEAVPDGMLKWREDVAGRIALDGIPYAIGVGKDGFVVAVDTRLIAYPTKRVIATTSGPVRAIAYHDDGRLYAAVGDHVEVYGADGKRLESWTSLGERAQVTSMAFFDGNLFICDSGNLCVWRFTSDGALERQFSGPKGVFVVPSPYFDVAATEDGVWIANPGVHHVLLYDADFNLKRTIGKTGMGPAEFSGCCNPSHIDVAKDGSIVTVEKGLPRVRVFETNGTLREFVASATSFSDSYPIPDMAVDASGRVLVLDRVKKAVRIFVRDAKDNDEK